MRHPAILVALALLTFATGMAVLANGATGATTMLDLAAADSSATLDVTVVSSDAVVPHEYALQNECYFSGRVSGPPDSTQRHDIVNWSYSAPPPYGNVPHAIMTVNLQAVPPGSTCRVFVARGNSVVRGSTTTYTVAQR